MRFWVFLICVKFLSLLLRSDAATVSHLEFTEGFYGLQLKVCSLKSLYCLEAHTQTSLTIKPTQPPFQMRLALHVFPYYLSI